ncbi:MAG: acylphosphatase [Candidatus Omnitrophica bacterium CG_4_9_14_0_2_um_filter_42_8]|nr:MAG: acylphosphatase [Candidatus Omnitrophica bacterium CG22_combo_CG10-13_8_21_14_all_43_16]PJC48450.1 MAG: acylphosphatase [Candidatus Omnitrophica bacterium CG_4_9_14_0_2_um_filter_42_8]
MKRLHVFYHGRVQGVGFRYSAQYLATNLGLGGWVKNLANGSVEIIAEGSEAEIKKFLDEISKGELGHYIKDTELSWEKPTGKFKDFDVRF